MHQFVICVVCLIIDKKVVRRAYKLVCHLSMPLVCQMGGVSLRVCYSIDKRTDNPYIDRLFLVLKVPYK